MPLEAGESLGPYEIIRQIGQGGMATVYQAYHAKLDRDVAVKVMHETFTQDETFLARFQREARIVASLEHPNIIPIYDYDDDGGRPYLVMKYVQGQTLKRRLMKRSLSLAEVQSIMMTVAEALTYAHENDVLHRDVKPSNIMIDSRDTPYLTDFGLARIAQLGSSTISHDVMLGTPFYISPEQAQGDKNLTPATDIYAFAILLYELLVGHVPFTADTPYAIVHEHIYTQPNPPSSVNTELTPEIDAVLAKGLAKDPTQRYATAVEMMYAFIAAMDASGVTELPEDRSIVALTPQPRREEPSQNPNISVKRDEQGRLVKVEGSWDMGNFDFSEFGKKVESKIRQGADYIEQLAEKIEEKSKSKPNLMTEEQRIRRRIEQRMKKRGELITHLVIYSVVNIVLWIIWLNSGIEDGAFSFPWPIFVTFFWGIGAVSNIVEYYQQHGAGAQRREEQIQRELDRELERSYARQQRFRRKNEPVDVLDMDDVVVDGRVRLNTDGELTDSFVDEISDTDGYQRGRG